MLHQISKPQYNRPMVNARTEDLRHRLVRQHRSNASKETYYIQSFAKANILLILRTLKGQYQSNTMINCIHNWIQWLFVFTPCIHPLYSCYQKIINLSTAFALDTQIQTYSMSDPNQTHCRIHVYSIVCTNHTNAQSLIATPIVPI